MRERLPGGRVRGIPTLPATSDVPNDVPLRSRLQRSAAMPTDAKLISPAQALKAASETVDDTHSKLTSAEVGYCKPPPWGQFQKGKSGNPAGSKKGGQNLSTIMKKEMETKVSVMEDGKKRSYTKLELMLKQLWNKASKGDYRSAMALFKFLERLDPGSFASLVPSSVDGGLDAERSSRMKALVREYFGKPLASIPDGASVASDTSNNSTHSKMNRGKHHE